MERKEINWECLSDLVEVIKRYGLEDVMNAYETITRTQTGVYKEETPQEPKEDTMYKSKSFNEKWGSVIQMYVESGLNVADFIRQYNGNRRPEERIRRTSFEYALKKYQN